MRVFRGIDSYEAIGPTCLTTGTFDGVHVGHVKILSQLNKIAGEEGLRSAMLTFHPHPRKVLFPDHHGLALLTTLDEKLELLERAGIQDVIIHPFSKEFSRVDPIAYVRDLLIEQLQMKHMVIGYDHRFGRNREGDIHQLIEMAPLYGFKVTEIAAQEVDDVNVSSTKIRKALDEGDVDAANTYLGYRYRFSGEVVPGKQRGKGLGFPTANIWVEDDTKLIPKEGVYAVDALLHGERFKGMMNIGFNPTFEQEGDKTMEVNLFNFDRDIYGERMIIELKKYLRPEKRFGDVNDLKKQMEKDRNDAYALD